MEKKIKKIPYGISDFEKIQEKNFYYVDKTSYIPLIENTGDYLFLIRPRRFGKSLWLNVLRSYYDVATKERFEEIFSGTFIQSHSTEEKNSYLILKFNFSVVNPSIDALEESFETYTGIELSHFFSKYKDFFDKEFLQDIKSFSRTADKLNCLFSYARENRLKIYLLIDEYDNFANTILSTEGEKRYKALTHGEGFFRYFFNVLKGGTTDSGAGLSKMFITGVSPLTMDDVTSGFNIGMNICLNKEMNALLGLTREEVEAMLGYYKEAGKIQGETQIYYASMSRWYNNYRFAEGVDENVFNTDMVLYYVYHIIAGSAPKEMIDHNVKTDYKKLRHLLILERRLNGSFSLLKEIAESGEISGDIVGSFPAEGLLRRDNFISLLFYLGLLTIDGKREGKNYLKIPNHTIRKLYYEYLREAYEDVDIFKVDVWQFGNKMIEMAYQGRWAEVFAYLADQIAEQTKIRDYLVGEKVIQGFLLAYMNITDHFMIQSEYEAGKGYVDIYCEPFLLKYPDMKYAYVIELKYINRSEDTPRLREEKLKEARAQLNRYAQTPQVTQTIGPTTLKKVILLFSGWELVAQEEMG